MVRIMNDSESPIVTMKMETTTVMSACDGENSCKGPTRIPPDDAATTKVTIGNSHTGNIVSSEWRCRVNLVCARQVLARVNICSVNRDAYMIWAIPHTQRQDIATSTHQSPH